MKRILLTSTALVMVAGVAAADGHSSISWSGTATAGVARNGGDEAKAAVAATATATQLTAHITLRNNAEIAIAGDGYGFTNTVVGAANTTVGVTASGTAISAAERVSQRKAIARCKGPILSCPAKSMAASPYTSVASVSAPSKASDLSAGNCPTHAAAK